MESKATSGKKYDKLYQALRAFMKFYDPKFTYSGMQINQTSVCLPHVDTNNIGQSYIIGLGAYSGGNLNHDGNSINIRNKMFKFHGQKVHYVEPFKGNRYSVVFFTGGKGRWKELARDKIRFPRDKVTSSKKTKKLQTKTKTKPKLKLKLKSRASPRAK
jgi:hypothetical protein